MDVPRSGVFRLLLELQERERNFLLNEILRIKGLMPLLMKPRNGQKWSRSERAEILSYLRRLSRLGPYLIVLALPGSFIALPALAWWLDRRRNGSPAQRAAYQRSRGVD